ncbi:MAG: cytochrome c [Elusimicrobia bacterium]|nr:cytochrome c [Elusimicrobiota bacterium]
MQRLFKCGTWVNHACRLFVLINCVPLSLLAFDRNPGQKFFDAAGCRSCHRIGNLGGNAGPDLTLVGIRRSKEWLHVWLKNPKAWKKNTLMPNFRLAPKTQEAIVNYLSTLQGQDYPPGTAPWHQGNIASIERGQILYNKAGCVACHGPQGKGGHPNNNVPGNAIPALTKLITTYTPDELKLKIMRGAPPPGKQNPDEISPLVFMPSWGNALTNQDLDDLTNYLFAKVAETTNESW